MEESYLKALQRQTSLPQNMKGVPVEVRTDIGMQEELPPGLEQEFRRRLMRLPDRLRKKLKRDVESAFPNAEEDAKRTNRAFNMRAKANVKRNEDVEDTKRKVMEAMREKEIADEKELIRKQEKEEDKQIRAQERKDATFVDFNSLGIYINEVDNRMEELQAELALEEQSYMAKNAIQGKDGNPTLLPIQQADLDAKLKVIKTKMKNLEGERELQIQKRVNEIAFKALRKFNNPEEVARRFRDVGLLQYYLKYLENDQARIK